MDELYGNAWGDSSDIAGDIQLRHSSWTSPKLTTHVEEADLAAPSWATGAGVQWNEPSTEEHGFRWSANDPDLEWADNTSYQIRIQSQSSDEVEEQSAHSPEVGDQEEEDAQVDDVGPQNGSPTVSLPTVDSSQFASLELDMSLSPPPSSPPLSRSSSPDGFGTFETGFVAESTAAPETLSPAIIEDDWGSPWVGTAQAEGEEVSKPVDEWEAARKQKEQLDRQIPPDVLANMLVQCTEFFQDPTGDPNTLNVNGATDDWMNQWRNGLDSIEGLEQLVHAVVPDLNLQPPVQFTKTSIAKSMAGAVRLTRNLSLAKSSPLSHYFAMKGSTTWEIALKKRKDVIEEDVVPAGWRILEKQPVADATDVTKTAKQGGLFSFWGRKHLKAPSIPDDTPTQATAPISLSRPPSVPPATEDRMSIGTSQESGQAPSPLKEDVESNLVSSPVGEVVPSPQVAAPSAFYADAPDIHPDSTPSPSEAPPSAVSRFLGRFSRTRNSLGASSSRSSLALSSDDLDLLSDIVPKAHDGFDDAEVAPIQPLANILKAEPLPPLLAPPPSVPATRPPLSSINAAASFASSIDSSLDKSLPTAPLTGDDLDDIFGAFESVSRVSVPAASTPFANNFAMFSSDPGGTTKAHTSTTTGFTSTQPSQASGSSSSVTRSLPLSTQRQTLQPSVLRPSPPVSRTGSTVAKSHHSISSDASSDVYGSHKPQMKLSLSLSISRPPSAASLTAPISASEAPLAQLYPNSLNKNSVINSGMSTARTPSPFVLDPVPRTRTATPMRVEGSSKAVAGTPFLPPPPSFAGFTKPSNPVPPNQNLYDDDDDFADFQSPSEPAPPEGLSSFAFALPPPPGSRGIAPAITPAAQASAMLGRSSSPPYPDSSQPFDNDFSAFFPSSSSARFPPHSTSSGFNSTFASSSDKSLFNGQHSHSDFDDLVSPLSSSALRTPSPPRPITKASRPSLSIKPPPTTTISPASDETRNRQRQHTLSLMERAAARPGRWPAPPSPLPQALAFPVPGSSAQNVDFMGDDDSFGPLSGSATPSSDLSLHPPAPGTASALTITTSLFESKNERKAPPFAPIHSSRKEDSRAGGLSAQDLSFFEGL